MLLTLLCLVPVVSPATTPDPPPGDLQEELLSVRGVLYSYMKEDSRGDTLLLTLLMRDLKDEVKEIRKLVTDSCEETASLRREIQEGKSLVSSKIRLNSFSNLSNSVTCPCMALALSAIMRLFRTRWLLVLSSGAPLSQKLRISYESKSK